MAEEVPAGATTCPKHPDTWIKLPKKHFWQHKEKRPCPKCALEGSAAPSSASTTTATAATAGSTATSATASPQPAPPSSESSAFTTPEQNKSAGGPTIYRTETGIFAGTEVGPKKPKSKSKAAAPADGSAPGKHKHNPNQYKRKSVVGGAGIGGGDAKNNATFTMSSDTYRIGSSVDPHLNTGGTGSVVATSSAAGRTMYYHNPPRDPSYCPTTAADASKRFAFNHGNLKHGATMRNVLSEAEIERTLHQTIRAVREGTTGPRIATVAEEENVDSIEDAEERERLRLEEQRQNDALCMLLLRALNGYEEAVEELLSIVDESRAIGVTNFLAHGYLAVYYRQYKEDAKSAIYHAKITIPWCHSQPTTNPCSQFLLGYMYYRGLIFRQNGSKVYEHMTHSAAKGFAIGQYWLGACYFQGWGSGKDFDLAFKWFRCSAIQGCADAQDMLSHCYQHGHGVAKNQQEADKWMKMYEDQVA